MQVGIVRARNPGHAAAMAHGILVGPRFKSRVAFLQRSTPPFPLNVAGFGIMSFQETGNVERIAASANDDMVADNNRRGRGEVLLLHVGNFLVPTLFSGQCIERNKIVVWSLEKNPASVHAHAAVADVNAALRLPRVMPYFASGAGIDGPCVVGSGEIEDAIYHQWCRFDGGD